MNDPQAPSQVLAEFYASEPKFITETSIARVWKVQSVHRLAALKVYHRSDMGAEANGFRFMDALRGEAAAKTYQTSRNAALTEWLDGPSLGDLTRAGNDKKANVELVNVANQLHSKTRNLGVTLPSLEDCFNALLALKIAPGCAENARQNIIYCQKLVSELLASQSDIRSLHGDLHHDNIRLGSCGYCCFDAIGILGERTFELANAFRNPKGAAAVVIDPARIDYLLDHCSVTFEVDRQRLLQWAAVKIALSISWRSNRALVDDAELPLLRVFVDMLAA